MCGIAGFVGTPRGLDARRAVGDMTDAMARRGPNGQGLFEWDGAVLGHRRLSIFDLSDAGRQPMLTPDRRLGVSFNGAIYNFLELRAELERDGTTFVSRTDTEVLLHGYRRWGIDALVRRLRGMFAFALWDADQDRLYLVRDRLGVKPLVYATGDDYLAFASTARALRQADLVREIDDLAVADLLEYGYVADEHVIFAGARKVPPATILEWSRGKVTQRTYWAPPTAGAAGRVTFDEAVEETERLLLRAVELRLQADVPVGALLSGGIDSALVCWAIRKLGGDITAFTIGTPGHAADETAPATATAREIGIPHRVLQMAAQDEDGVTDLVAAYGEPFATSSALGMLRVSAAVSQAATVLLTGDGGDDVFLGYPRHKMLLGIERTARRIPAPAARAWYAARRLVPPVGPAKRARHLIDYTTAGLGAFLTANPGLPSLRRQGFLGERLRDTVVSARRIPWSVASARHALSEYLAYDLRHQFVAEYLTKVDGATMFHALEARSPFLDQEMWEFAAGLPYETRLHGGELKAILREIVRRRISPRAASEQKRGFTVPVETWVRGRWRPLVQRAMEDSVLDAAGFVRADAVLAALRKPTIPETTARQLWYLLVAERWLRAAAQDGAVTAAPSRLAAVGA